ncbi:MAG: Ig-like domain-containing protein [bacterium]
MMKQFLSLTVIFTLGVIFCRPPAYGGNFYPVDALGESRTRSIALGDIDLDGDLDLAVGNRVGEPNLIYFNDGTGYFRDSGQRLGQAATIDVVLGDLDNDGDLDLVAGNQDEDNRVYLNNGQGYFFDSGQALTSSFTHSLGLGDLDGDGDLDLVVGNRYGNPDRIFTNDGLGHFTDSGQALGQFNTISLALGDVDGDGDLDIAAGHSGGEADRIYLNDGRGVFTDSNQDLGVCCPTTAIALADMDDDDDLDLVAVDLGHSNYKIYLNDGLGIFTLCEEALNPNSNTYGLAMGDIDKDGDLDIAIGSYGQPNRIYFNQGDCRFSDSGQALGKANTYDVVLGDLNADGYLDLIAGNDGQPDIVYLYDPTEPASKAVSPPYVNSSPIKVSFEASDPDGIAKVRLFFRKDGGQWRDSGLILSGNQGTFDFQPSGEGRYEFFTQAIDSRGSIESHPSEADSLTIYDITAPRSQALTIPECVWESEILIPFEARDVMDGIKEIRLYYRRNNGPWVDSGLANQGTIEEILVPDPGPCCADGTTTSRGEASHGTFSFIFPGEGKYEFYTIVVDMAQNTESSPEKPDIETYFDLTPPPPLENLKVVDTPNDFGRSLTATWKASPASDLDHYNIYLANSPIEDIQGLSPILIISYPKSEIPTTKNYVDYYVAVTAVDICGHESQAARFGPVQSTDDSDRLAPASKVSSPQCVLSGDIYLTIEAADRQGSGVAKVDLWYRKDKGSWRPSGLSTSEVSATLNFTPPGPGDYEFYSIAIDRNGNTETPPSIPDSITYFGKTPPPPIGNLKVVDTPQDSGLSLIATWDPSPVEDLDHYHIYLSHSAIKDIRGLTPILTIQNPLSTIPTLRDYLDYYVAVTAVDICGNEDPEVIDFGPVHSINNADIKAPYSTASSPECVATGDIPVRIEAGDDSGSNLAEVVLWYRKDEGEFRESGFSTDKPREVFFFTPSGEGVYEFYTIARDRTGNTESRPLTPDSRTYWGTIPPPRLNYVKAIDTPNDTGGWLTVSWEKSQAADFDHYKVYLSSTPLNNILGLTPVIPAIYDRSVTMAIVPTPEDYLDQYVAVTAADVCGNEIPDPIWAGPVASIDNFDITPPVSYVSSPLCAEEEPIIIDPFELQIQAYDDRSGVRQIELWFQIDGQGWQKSNLVAKCLSCTLDFFPERPGTYQFYTIAVDRAGNRESPPDQPDSLTYFGFTPPPAVAHLKVTDTPNDTGGSLTVIWDPVYVTDFDHYNIYLSSEPFSDFSIPPSRVPTKWVRIPHFSSATIAKIPTPKDNVDYYVVVTAVDICGNETPYFASFGPVQSQDNTMELCPQLCHGATVYDATPLFCWGIDPEAQFLLQVDDRNDFLYPLEFEINVRLSPTTFTYDTPDTLALKVKPDGSPKRYYWRVGGDAVTWSQVCEFTLSAPVLVSPARGESVICGRPTLHWDEIAGPDAYLIEIDDQPDFLSPLIRAWDENNYYTPGDWATASEAGADSLPAGKYYWRVAGYEKGKPYTNWSPVWEFTIGRIELISPLEASQTNNPAPTFSWRPATELSESGYYLLQIASSNYFGDSIVVEERIDAPLTAYTPTSLTALKNGTYFWRVRGVPAKDGECPVDWSLIRKVIIDQRLLEGPDAPVLRLPPCGEKVNTSSPSLVWYEVSTPSAIPALYQIQIDHDGSFSIPDSNDIDISVSRLSKTTYSPSPLPDGLWFWRVRAIDPGNNDMVSNWSEVCSFVVDTTGPGAPGLTSPANNACIRDTTPEFSWTLMPPAGLQVTYRVEVDTDEFKPPLILRSNILSSTRYTSPLVLSSDQTYYWRVVGIDEAGNESLSLPFSFLVDIFPPTFPANEVISDMPAPGIAINDPTPTFIWKPWQDSSGRKLTYDFELGELDSGFNSPLVSVSDLTEPTYTTALSDGDYIWHVRARDCAGNLSPWKTQMVTIDTVPPCPVQLLSPLNGISVPDATPTLDWEDVTDAKFDHYVIEVLDEGGRLVAQTPFNTKTISVFNIIGAYALPDGIIYQWRVGAADKAGNLCWSPVWKFKVDTTLPPDPRPISPEHNSCLSTSTPTFDWADVNRGEEVLSYIFELDNDPQVNFINPMVSVPNLKESTFTLPPAFRLKEGHYYWRVRSTDAAGNISPGKIMFSLTIDRTPSDMVVISSPPDGILTNDDTPTLDWDEPEAGLSYQIQIDDDPDFSSPLLDIADFTEPTWEGSFITISPALPEGTYHWRVRSFDCAKNASEWSFSQRFTIDTTAPDAPVLLAPENYALLRDKTPLFQWWELADSVTLGADYAETVFYLIQIETDENLTDGFDEAIKFSTDPRDGPEVYQPRLFQLNPFPNLVNFTPSLLPGIGSKKIFYWRVFARDMAGNESTYSATWAVIIDPHNDSAPTLVAPADGTYTRDAAPFFDWSDEDEATYHLQVDNNIDFRSPEIDESKLTRSSFTFTVPLPDGTYYWRVRTIDTAGNISPWSEDVWRLYIDTDMRENLVPILVTPANRDTIDYNRPQFDWEPISDRSGVEYTLQVAATPDFASPLINRSEIKESIFESPFELSEGVYYWRVEAFDSAANQKNWSVTFTFTIDQLPPLAPTLLSPLNGDEVNNAYPTFTWTEVPGAATYIFELDRNDDFSSPEVYADKLTHPAYTVKGVPLLLGSVYFWRVRAVDDVGNMSPWSDVWSMRRIPTYINRILDDNPPYDPLVINRDTTWEVNGSPYVIEAATIVEEGTTLTIKPGVEVLFSPKDEDQLQFMVKGTLKADGTEENNITFTSVPHWESLVEINILPSSRAPSSAPQNQSPDASDESGSYRPFRFSPAVPGDWQRLRFAPTSRNSSLSFVHIEYAGLLQAKEGKFYRGSLEIDSTQVQLDHVTVTNSAGYGLLYTGSALPATTDSSPSDTGSITPVTPDSNLPQADRVPPTTADSSGSKGCLPAKAAGRNASVITTSKSAAAGDTILIITNSNLSDNGMDGIRLQAAGGEIRIENCQVLRNGGFGIINEGNYEKGNLTDLIVLNSNISSNRQGGIYSNSRASEDIRNNRIANNNGWAVHKGEDSLYPGIGGYVIEGNEITGNLHNGIFIEAALQIKDTVWKSSAPIYFDYILISPGVKLDIEPGVIVKTTGGFKVEGKLTVRGEEDNKVVITSYYDDAFGGDTNGDGFSTGRISKPGDWASIIFEPGSQGSLTQTVIRYSEEGIILRDASPDIIGSEISYHVQGAITLYGSASPLIKDNLITFNDSEERDKDLGVIATFCQAETRPVIEGNTISYNVGYPLDITANLAAYVKDNFIRNNFPNAIRICGDITDPSVVWKETSCPFFVREGLKVNNGSLWKIDPGVTIKLGGPVYINGSGQILARGETARPIYFTSLKDDTLGGDTNQDGGATTPGKGDWGGITFNNATSRGTLDGVVIRYGAVGVEAVSASPLISNSTIFECGTGVSCRLGGSPQITKTILPNNDYGVFSTTGSQPVITGCEITGNLRFGVVNTDETVTIKAENNWWGDVKGPLDDSPGPPSYNPYAKGDRVSDYVDYLPWEEKSRTPVASAGEDITVTTLNLVILDGSASFDPDGENIFFRWTQIEGPETIILDQTVQPTFTPQDIGVYRFQLVVIDAAGRSSLPDEVKVTSVLPKGHIPLKLDQKLYVKIPGETFEIRVEVGDRLHPAQDLFGVAFKLNYSRSDILDFVSASPGGFLSSNPDDLVFMRDEVELAKVDEKGGQINIGISRKRGVHQIGVGSPAEGVLAYLRFKLNSGAAKGEQIELTFSDVTATDHNGRSVGLFPIGSKIQVGQGQLITATVWPGDTNNDGWVDAKDVLPIGLYWKRTGLIRPGAATDWKSQQVTAWSPLEATYADANGDGVVEAKDVLPIGLNWHKKAGSGEEGAGSREPGAGSREPGSRLSDNLDYSQYLEAFRALYQALNGGNLIEAADLENSKPDDPQAGALNPKLTEAEAEIKAYLEELIQAGLSHQIPATSRISQNYPNPVNPETWIPFALSEREYVTINIYNLSGQLVRILEIGELEAGTYASKAQAAYWDGKDQSGQEVSSGVYLYRLQAGSQVSTRRMIVLK